MLWCSTELRQVLQPLDERGRLPDVAGVSIDSRTLVAGDLFIALSGDFSDRFHVSHRNDRDGHDYVKDAAVQGAVCALVSRFVDSDIPQILVSDTLDGLWALAAAARHRSQAVVIGLTGSSGKTTLKRFLTAATDGFASRGSLNNFLGLPLSMARLPSAETIAIFEIGMNYPGEVAGLSRLLRPDVAVVLNVLPVHLEGLGSLSAIKEEKLSITQGLSPEAVLVVPDQLEVDQFWPGKTITFGEGDEADVRLLSKGQGADCRVQAGGSRIDVQLPSGGHHRQLTASAALATVMAIGGDLQQAGSRLAKAELVEGRGNHIEVAGVTIIDDSYNANPASMTFALQALAQSQGAKYAILGDMLELGAEAHSYHQALAPLCSSLDGLWLVGTLMEALASRLPDHRSQWVASSEQLDLSAIAALLAPGDTLLIKGSNRIFWQTGFVKQLIEVLSNIKLS